MITFQTKAYGNVSMFDDIAVELLEMMGHSGTVPSAMAPEDIPAAVKKLKSALASTEDAAADQGAADSGDEDDEHVSLKNRAFPLIQLLEAAARDNESVMWDSRTPAT